MCCHWEVFKQSSFPQLVDGFSAGCRWVGETPALSPAICNHDQSSDLWAVSQLVSLLWALLFWACSSPLGEPFRQVHGRLEGSGGTVHARDLCTCWHRDQSCVSGSFWSYWSEQRSTSFPEILTGRCLSLAIVSNRPLPGCIIWVCLKALLLAPFEEILICILKIQRFVVPSLSDSQPLTFIYLLSSKPTIWLILHSVSAIKELTSAKHVIF